MLGLHLVRLVARNTLDGAHRPDLCYFQQICEPFADFDSLKP